MRTFKLSEAAGKIPEDLADLLVRCAYIDYSLRTLTSRQREAESNLENVKATQPPFLIFKPKETRVAFKLAQESSIMMIEATQKALDVNTQLAERLRQDSEDLLEKWLRDHCEEYRLGLAAERFSADWEYALMRFTRYTHTFIRALGSARNMAPAGYNHAKCMYLPSTYEAINEAHALAKKVEEEIVATNAIAEEHDTMLGSTVFNDPMPRIADENYADVVSSIAVMPPAQGQAEFNRLITALEDLVGRELDALRERVRLSASEHTARTESYVRDAWNQLHDHALRHSIDPSQVEAVVEQTKRMYKIAPAPKIAPPLEAATEVQSS